MNPEASEYSRIEYARRFLVASNAGWQNFVEPYSKTHEDKYLRGARLRLRILTDSDSPRQLLKLTKKFESVSPYFRQVTTIILSAEEYRLLDALEGNRMRKTRYYHRFCNRVFSIDVFENELDGLVVCEIEDGGLDDLMTAELPAYVGCEITEDIFFTGGNLCRVTNADLLRKLAAVDNFYA